MPIFRKTFAAIIAAAAVGLAACARGETVTVEPTLITTREGLAAIANDLGGSYALGAEIDLGGADWTPIGTESAPFTGTLRGNNHAIRNLFCTNSLSGSDYRGLFGCVSGAVIKDVSVSGTVAGKQYVGGLVGCITGGTVISNCIATVEVAATNSYAGGLIGACAGGSAVNRIVDCRADGFVSGNGSTGGFIGYVYAPAVISNCVARGDVRSAASYYGGFIGQLDHDDAIIDGCWCSGAVWGTGGDIGSFIGHHERGTNVNCAVSAYANGPRPFCGNDPAITDGKPYVKLPTIVNTEGATVTVLATEDLVDWTRATKYQVDPATGICAPDFDPVPPKMFFKYSIDVDDN